MKPAFLIFKYKKCMEISRKKMKLPSKNRHNLALKNSLSFFLYFKLKAKLNKIGGKTFGIKISN